MKAVRTLTVLLAVCVIAPACSDSPTSPAVPPAEPQAHLRGSGLRPTGLLQCSALPFSSKTRTITPEGGILIAGPHRLWIPPGALAVPTQITMTATTDRGVNEVHLEPEGLQFERPALLTMSYANCNLLGRLLLKRIAYTDNALTIRYYVPSLDNLWTKRVTGRLDHFSDYVVAW